LRGDDLALNPPTPAVWAWFFTAGAGRPRFAPLDAGRHFQETFDGPSFQITPPKICMNAPVTKVPGLTPDTPTAQRAQRKLGSAGVVQGRFRALYPIEIVAVDRSGAGADLWAYAGVDASQAALTQATKGLAGARFRVQLREADMLALSKTAWDRTPDCST